MRVRFDEFYLASLDFSEVGSTKENIFVGVALFQDVFVDCHGHLSLGFV